VPSSAVTAPAQVGLGQGAEVAEQVLAPSAQAHHADGDRVAHSWHHRVAGRDRISEVDHERRLDGHPGVVDGRVGGDDADDVGCTEKLVGEWPRLQAQLALGQAGHERVVVRHVGPLFVQKPDQFDGG